jgi:hypothetical protein
VKMSPIELANIAGAAASIVLLANFVLLASGLSKKTSLKISFAGSAFGMIAGLLLQTQFLVGLNVIWMVISIYGLLSETEKTKLRANFALENALLMLSLLPVVMIPTILFKISGIFSPDAVGWTVALVYVLGYLGFSSGYIRRVFYMVSCTFAGLAMAWALYQSQQYAISIKELLTALIGLAGALRITLSHQKHKSTGEEITESPIFH